MAALLHDTASPQLGARSSTIGGDGEEEKPPEKLSNPRSPFKSYIRVFSYNDRLGWAMNAVAALCMIAAGSLLPLMDVVFGKFVSMFNDFTVGRLSPEGYRDEVSRYTLWFLYLFVAKFLLTYIWTVLISMSALRTTKELRKDYLRQTLRQEIGYFDSARIGSISSQVTTNGNLVNQGISEKLGLTIQATSTFVTAFIVAFVVQWKLTLITVSIVPVILIVTAICVVIDTGHENAIMTIDGRAGQIAEEVFGSVRNVHAFWGFSRLAAKYHTVLQEARAVGMRRSPNYAVMYSAEFFCIYAGYGLAFWRGIHMYQSGEIGQPGQVVTVIFAVIVAATALTQVAPQFIVLAKAVAAADELFETIDRDPEIDALGEDGLWPRECLGEIEFRNVEFAYPTRPDVQVLRGLDLIVPAERTTAIVGVSGSGKSTIVGMLERWYSPESGTVSLDGCDISQYNVRWLRTTIRLVQQEPVMFNGTIFQNVAYGLAGTSMAQAPQEEQEKLVREACKAAYAHEFIEQLPQGYHTEIGQRGAMVSGGQKQRIAIARSIVSNPRIMLLDEATSALDPTAEKIVQKALNNVAFGRTMVVIAHRLSTIRNADNIVVMNAGRIVEQGTHDELLALDGAYASLVRAQDLGQKTERANASDSNEEGGIEGEVPEERQVGMSRPQSVAISDVDRAEFRRRGGPAFGPENGDDHKSTSGDKTPNYSLIRCLSIIVREQRDLWLVLLLTLALCILGGGTYPAMAVIFSRALDAFAKLDEEATRAGDFWALMFFVLALGNLCVYAALGWFSNVVGTEIMARYRLEMFEDILGQAIPFFDAPEHTTGGLASKLSSEPEHLQELLSFNIGLVAVCIVNLASSCVLALVYGWKLGLVLVFAALPPLVFSGYLRIRLESKLDSDTSARFAASAGVASEAVSAIRTVSSLAIEPQILERFNGALDSIVRRAVGNLGWSMLWYSLSQSMQFLAMALGFWYGGMLVSRGEYTATQFYVVFIATIFSGEAAATFFQYTTSFTKARHAANCIFGLRATIPAHHKSASNGTTPRDGDDGGKGGGGLWSWSMLGPLAHEKDLGPHIECRDLAFSYPQRPRDRVLRGVSATVRPGQFVAFVGPSGCGKTTMISLLERFYDPSSGRVVLDGMDVRGVGLAKYRSEIALVQQEPVLYQGSIRENIALGAVDRRAFDGGGDDTSNNCRSSKKWEGEEPSEEEILEACRQANIADFVASLPEGLNTACGSQGLSLSGGQRQRIAIARALVRRPRLLLLDEATSSLDSESERIVQAALERAAEGRSTVAVAHRLSTIKAADVIYVFARGRVAEYGTHEELLERKGVYYDMCLGQSLDRAAAT